MMPQKSDIRTMLGWAAAGLLFIINAFLIRHWLDDGGFVSSVSAMIAVVILLVPIIRTVIIDIRTGNMRMHELVVLAIAASCIQRDPTTSACIAFFMLLSMVIESKTASGAQASLEALAKLAPGKVHRLDTDGNEVDVESRDLRPGDLIRVRPSENILADGCIVKGRSSVNQANITGESLPVDKAEGDEVFAGTINLNGALEIRIEKAGEDTTIGKVKELILKAEASRLPFVRIIDQYIKYYTPAVLVLAATVLFFNRHTEGGLDRVVALLVATCPIALILASPTAVVAALAAAARLGVLFKDVNDLEALAGADAFIFDKTGTLTAGVLEVARLAPVDGIESTELLAAAGTAELQSNHPVARAVQALARKVNLMPPPPDRLHEEPGRGVRATLGEDEILVGNQAWIQENEIDCGQFKNLQEAEESGMSLLFVARNHRALGWIGLSDRARKDAKECLAELKSLGVGFTAMVSGDRKKVVEAVSIELGIDQIQGECDPAHKVDFVNDVKARGYRVAFVGDGVNDGPALACSDIGVAMGSAGNDVALESATVALMNNRLNRLPFLLKLARRMNATVIQNFCLGGAFIVGGVVLSATGRLSALPASFIQVVGALAVAMNSARLIRQGEDLDGTEQENPASNGRQA